MKRSPISSPNTTEDNTKSTETTDDIESTENTTEVATDVKERPIKVAKRIRREVKVAKTVAIITIAYIICLFPLNAYIFYVIKVKSYSDVVISIFWWLVLCNSGINPILYGYFNENFRKAFKNVFVLLRLTKAEN